MVALVGPLGLLHVPQKPVHFGQGETAVRAHGAMTGDRVEKPVSELLDDRRLTEVLKIL